MNKIYLKFGRGIIEAGFSDVTAEFFVDEKLVASVTGALPANRDLQSSFSSWQELWVHFCKYQDYGSRAFIKSSPIRSFSTKTFQKLSKDVNRQLNEWLLSDPFREVSDRLIEFINQHNNVRIILRVDDLDLIKLPWHSWDLIQRYDEVELAFANLNFQATRPIQPRNRNQNKNNKIKILTVVGDSRNISLVERDVQLISSLPNVNCHVLKEPTVSNLHQKLSSDSWDILFYTGHGETIDLDNEKEGVLHLNSDLPLTIISMKHVLRSSIGKGLKLVILNSCDGLALSQQLLSETSLSYSISFRQIIPDVIAHSFLEHFIDCFSKGLNLHLAVRKAQEKLEVHHSDFPFVGSLPVIYQNLDAPSLTWEKLDSFIKNKLFDLSNLKSILSDNLTLKDRMSRRKSRIGFYCFILLAFFLGGGSLINFKIIEFADIKSKSYSASFPINRSRKILLHTSLGENILFPFSKNNSELEKGAESYFKGCYDEAGEHFRTAWIKDISNPESSIYYFNSLAKLEAKSTYTIAVTISSENPWQAKEILRGVAVAQHEFNKQSDADDSALQIMIVDVASNPKSAEELPGLLGENQNVLGVIAHDKSVISKNVVAAYREAKLPLVPLVRSKNNSKFHAEQIVDSLNSSLSRNVAIFYSGDNANIREIKEEVVRNLKDSEISAVKNVDLSDSLNPELELAHLAYKKEVDTVLVFPSESSNKTFFGLIRANSEFPQENKLKLVTSNLFWNYTPTNYYDKSLKLDKLTSLTSVLDKWDESGIWRTSFASNTIEVLTAAKTFDKNINLFEVLNRLQNPQSSESEEVIINYIFEGDTTTRESKVTVLKLKDSIDFSQSWIYTHGNGVQPTYVRNRRGC